MAHFQYDGAFKFDKVQFPASQFYIMKDGPRVSGLLMIDSIHALKGSMCLHTYFDPLSAPKWATAATLFGQPTPCSDFS